MCLKFCEDYFGVHICIIMFPSSWKKYPFPDRSNRDTLTHIHVVYVVKSNFLLRYAPGCTFSSRKMKKLPSVGGGTPPFHPPPTPSPRSVATLPRKDCAPQIFWLITPLHSSIWGEMSMVNLGHSGHLSIFTLLKHLMMLLKYNFFQGLIFTPYQRHWYHLGPCSSDFFKVKTLLNNAFNRKPVWSLFLASVTRRAAEFWIRWSLEMCFSGRPRSRLLQLSRREVTRAWTTVPVSG